MSAFESVVRPFQLPNAAPARQYVEARQQSQPPVKLYFGRSGSGRTFNGAYQSNWARYQVQVAAEDRRAFYELPKVNFDFNIDFPSFSV